MAPASFIPQQPENTAFLKELQWKENRSQDEFLGNLLSDETLPKDHIALKHSSSSSSGAGPSHVLKNQSAKPVNNTSKAVDDPEIYTQLSINLWRRLNAGYLIPRRPPQGVTSSTFTYDPSMIEHQSKEFHRKRDFYSEYNEAAARFKLVHGNKKPLSKPKRGDVNSNAAVGELNALPPDGTAQPLIANPDSTNPITDQINKKSAPTTTISSSNPSAQNSTPTSTTSESKAAQPP